MNKLTIYDLRCGNILMYLISEGKWQPTVIDWQDLKWISEDPDGFNKVHKPIPLTKEWLMKLGFAEIPNEKKYVYDKVVYGVKYLQLNKVYDYAYDAYFEVCQGISLTKPAVSFNSQPIKFAHQLQNLYYALTKLKLEL